MDIVNFIKGKEKDSLLKKPFWKAFFINVFYMLCMFLFWEPFFWDDDYMFTETLYGVYTAEPSHKISYVRLIYSRFLCLLNNISSCIPWHSVVYYALVFVSFFLFAFVIYSNYDTVIANIVINLFFLCYAYEAYISIHFTKVGGVLCVISAFLLFYKKSNLIIRIASLILIMIAGFLRYDIIKMVLMMAIFLIFASFIYDLFSKKQIIRTIAKYKSIFPMLFLFLLIVLVVPFIPSLSDEEEKEYWDRYWKYNAVRSGIQDFGYPDYQENAQFYQEIGISENDLKIYYNWNVDKNTITLEKGEQILSLKESEGSSSGFGNLAVFKKVFDFEKVVGFFKIFPISFLKINAFYLFVLFFVIFIILGNNKVQIIQDSVISILCILVVNYYMYLANRYLQHNVDVVVFAGGILYLIYNMQTYVWNNKKRSQIIVSIMMVLMLCLYYKTDKKDVEREQYVMNMNRIFMNQTTEDRNGFYVIGNTRRTSSLVLKKFYKVFERPEAGIGRNIYTHNGNEDSRLIQKGISDTYSYIIDNKHGFLVLTSSIENEMWEVYYTEHYGDNCKLYVMANYLEREFCQILTQEYMEKLFNEAEYKNSKMVNDSVEINCLKNKLQIEGSMFIKDDSGFSDTIFLQITDYEGKNERIIPLTKNVDENKIYGDAGYFSYIKDEVEIDEEDLEKMQVRLLLCHDDREYVAEKKWK